MKRQHLQKNTAPVIQDEEEGKIHDEEYATSVTYSNRSTYGRILKRIIIVLLVLVVVLKVVGFLFDWDEEVTANLSPEVKEYRRRFLNFIGLE
jgi:hypothetical protein